MFFFHILHPEIISLGGIKVRVQELAKLPENVEFYMDKVLHPFFFTFKKLVYLAIFNKALQGYQFTDFFPVHIVIARYGQEKGFRR